jgi:hypothetical protein
VVIGDIPQWSNDDAECLSTHMRDVQDCAVAAYQAPVNNAAAEKNAAESSGAEYIPTARWICELRCEPIIAGMRVFLDTYHLTGTYVEYLSGALQQELALSGDGS